MKRIYVGLVAIGMVFGPTLVWLGQSWFGSGFAVINLAVFAATIGIIVKKQYWKFLRLRERVGIAELGLCGAGIGVHVINQWLWEVEILSAGLWIMVLMSWVGAFLDLNPRRRPLVGVMVGLLVLGLPVFGILGATVGLLFRHMYAEILMLVANVWGVETEKVGTMLITGDRATAVDASCSGVLGSYVIGVIGLLYLLYTERVGKAGGLVILKSIGVYLIGNGGRIAIIFGLHNVVGSDNVGGVETVVGSGTLGLGLWWMGRGLNKLKWGVELH